MPEPLDPNYQTLWAAFTLVLIITVTLVVVP